MLLHDDGRHALFLRDASNGLQKLLNNDGGQALKGLVQKQQFWVDHQGAAYSQHLLLATRELGTQIGLAFCKAGKQLIHTGRRPRARACHGGEVFIYRERLENIALLRHPTYARTGTLM